MQNFNYYTPTRLIFGHDAIKSLPEVLAKLGKKVLITYGGGSIKKIGLYDEVIKLLRILKYTSLRELNQILNIQQAY